MEDRKTLTMIWIEPEATGNGDFKQQDGSSVVILRGSLFNGRRDHTNGCVTRAHERREGCLLEELAVKVPEGVHLAYGCTA